MCCCCMQSDTRAKLDVAKYAFKTKVKKQQAIIYLFTNTTTILGRRGSKQFSAGLPIGLN